MSYVWRLTSVAMFVFLNTVSLLSALNLHGIVLIGMGLSEQLSLIFLSPHNSEADNEAN